MTQENNKLIEMARAYWQERVDHIDHIINGKSFSDHMAAFAQHVLDKQWTRVEDGLPEEEGSYLCSCIPAWGFESRKDAVFELRFEGGRWEDNAEYQDINDFWKIIAWCELPQPYVQPEKEGK